MDLPFRAARALKEGLDTVQEGFNAEQALASDQLVVAVLA